MMWRRVGVTHAGVYRVRDTRTSRLTKRPRGAVARSDGARGTARLRGHASARRSGAPRARLSSTSAGASGETTGDAWTLFAFSSKSLRAMDGSGVTTTTTTADDAAVELRRKLEHTSARALEALERKDETIVALRRELANARAEREAGRREQSGLDGRRHRRRDDAMVDSDWSNDENDHPNEGFEGTRARRKIAGGRRERARLERALEDERGVVARLRGELREANANVEKLREVHNEATYFFEAGESHAESLKERLQRTLLSRDKLEIDRETAAEERERALVARVAALDAERAQANEAAEAWKSKATVLETELDEIKRRAYPTDDQDEGSADRLRVRLAETRLALRETLEAQESSSFGFRAVKTGTERELAAVSTSTRSAREDAKLKNALEKISSLKVVIKGLRGTNATQANELGRLETLLREQIATNKLTAESAEAISEGTAREREHYAKALRQREEELFALRETVTILESDREVAIDGVWLQRELSKARDKIVALETENATLLNDRELLAGEVRQLRHEVKGESERANTYEAISIAAHQREQVLSAQLEWKTEECYTYMETELDLLDYLDDAEREALDAEIGRKSCEQALQLQMKRMGDFSAAQILELKQHIEQSVAEASDAHAVTKFCRDIQNVLRTKPVGSEETNHKLEAVLMDTQRTICRLESSAMKHEAAFFAAMRHIAKLEHQSAATKTAFDHVCAILELSQKSYASFGSNALSSMEKRLTVAASRSAKLARTIARGAHENESKLHELEEELLEREEQVQLMKARIEELEITGNELLAARDSAANAMQTISVARDNAKKELFQEQDRLREALRTVADLDAEIALMKDDIRAPALEQQNEELSALVEEQAQAISAASEELERRVADEIESRQKLEEVTRELKETRDRLSKATAQAESGLEEVRVARERLAEFEKQNNASGVDMSSTSTDLAITSPQAVETRTDTETLVAVALEDNRAAAIVAAAARSDVNASRVEVERLYEELRRRDEEVAPSIESAMKALESISARLEDVLAERDGKYEVASRALEHDATALQAFAEVMSARLLNLEAELAEQKRKEEEWLASNKPSDEERRAHIERCKRYRELMQRLREQHEGERAKLLEYVNDSETKIAELTKRVQNSWAGETEAELAALKEELANSHEHIARLQARITQQDLVKETHEGGYALLEEFESSNAELRDTKAKLAASEDEAERLKEGLEKCASQLNTVREETKKAVEQQLTLRFRRELARREDEVEQLHNKCSEYVPPCVSLVEAVRMLVVRLLRISAAVVHLSRSTEGVQSIAETMLQEEDANEVASLVGLSLQDITSVFAVRNIRADASTDETRAALNMLDSPANVSAAMAWCEARTAQLNDALTSKSSIAEVWREDALEAVTSLAHEKAREAESYLRSTTPELERWWSELE